LEGKEGGKGFLVRAGFEVELTGGREGFSGRVEVN